MATAICAEALEERQTTWFKPRSWFDALHTNCGT